MGNVELDKEAPITQGALRSLVSRRMSVATSRRFGVSCICILMCWLATGCSSSNSSSGNGGGGQGLQFTQPTVGPTIELSNPPQTVALTVNQAVTWSLQSGTGFGKPVGQLTNQSSTTATYVAPTYTGSAGCVGEANTAPPTSQQVTVVATSTSDSTQSTTITIVIDQSQPCVATPNQIIAATTTGSQTYTSCPPNGTAMVFNGNGGQLMQVNTFASLQIGDGGY